MLAGGLLTTTNDAIVKWVTVELPIGELIFLRALCSVLLILLYARAFAGLDALRIRSLRAQTVRGGTHVGATFLYVFGLSQLPLADFATAMFATPIMIAAIAPFVLAEHVGWRRWAAILVGFGGVVVLTRPGTAGIDWAILLPLAAAAATSIRDTATRRITVTEASLAVLFFTMLLETAVSLATAPFGWIWPSWSILGYLLVAASLFVVAQFLFVEAFRRAEAAVVAPFRYVLLLWAAFWGYIVWGDVPDAWTLAGAAIIIGSGLYIFHRETALRRRSA